MPYLPPELWILVVSFINDNHTLANLCRISETFKEICEPALYKSPMVSDDQVAIFTRTLLQSSHLARQVKILDHEYDLWWNSAYTPLKDVPKALIQEHTVTLISRCYSLPDSSLRRGLQAFLQRHITNKDLCDSAGLFQSMLMSLLPNLEEARIELTDEVFLDTVPAGSLSRLRIVHIKGDWGDDDEDRLRFEKLEALAQASTNLDSLFIEACRLNLEAIGHRQTSHESFTKFPVFPKVTNLALDAWWYNDLQNVAKFFQSFPLLQSFRIDGWRNFETPSLPKFKGLLGAIASHAVGMKHLRLEGAIADLFEHLGQMGDECSKSTWTDHLQDITRIKTLDTLSIDTWTLWPFKNATGLPDSLLLHCIPESLRHLHVNGVTHETLPVFVDLVDLQFCLLELARALSVGRFRCLRLISFESNDSSEMDLSEAKQALMKVGVSLVQRHGPWREGDGHGLFQSD